MSTLYTEGNAPLMSDSPDKSLHKIAGSVASTAANQTTANSSLSTIATNTAVQLGGGAVTATTQRVTLATDGPGVANLATIATNTTGVSTAANQSTGNGYLSTIATNSGTQATAANQSTANTKLDQLHTDITTGKISVVSPRVNPQSTFQRTAAAAQYAAYDVIANATSTPTLQSFANCTRANGGSGTILSARAFLDQATLPTGWNTLRMHLYHDTVTQLNDNDPFTMLFANRLKRIGFIDFSGWQTGGAGSDSNGCLVTGINLPFTTSGTSLYYILETRSALTTNFAQNANLFFELQILQD